MKHFFQVETGEAVDSTSGPSIHHADGFLWFWGGPFEFTFRFRSHDKDTEYPRMRMLVAAIRKHLSSKEDIEEYFDEMRINVETVQEDQRTSLFIWEQRSCFMFQMDTNHFYAFADFLDSILLKVSAHG